MARRRGRGLRGEEAELWAGFARSVRPLRPLRPAPAPEAEPPPPPPPPAPEPPAPAILLRPGPPPAPIRGTTALKGPVTPLGPATPGLDRRTAERLRRGRAEPHARLDLHGMTLEAAHAALAAFIRRTQGQGLRLVLVITGKGRPPAPGEGWFEGPGGVLRASVPRWLALPPLVELVTGIYPAHPRHGGGGAFYVYLRKRGQAGPAPQRM